MKQWIYLLGLLLLATASQASTWSTPIKTIDSCDNLSILLVNHSLNYDAEEISFYQCTGDQHWTCACNGSAFEILLQAKMTTVNDYEFQINYTTHNVQQTETTKHKRRGGGGSFTITPANQSNTTNTTNTTAPVLRNPFNETSSPFEIYAGGDFRVEMPVANDTLESNTTTSGSVMSPLRDWTRVYWVAGVSLAIIMALFIYITIASTRSKEEE